MSEENCPICEKLRSKGMKVTHVESTVIEKRRPLDRGKVLALAENIKARCESRKPFLAFDMGYRDCVNELVEAINSGRLDVEEG